MSAIISACGKYRYRLERDVAMDGITIAYFGINPSTANADEDDATSRKWTGFTKVNGGRHYIAGNPFAYRATDVRELAKIDDPWGPDNDEHIAAIIADSDVLVPCWGNTSKVPPGLRRAFAELRHELHASGKPVKVFGFTKAGDPMHPLMLGYKTELKDWIQL